MYAQELRYYNFAPHHSPTYMNAGFASHSVSLLGRTLPSVRFPAFLRPPIAQTKMRWYRNLNLSSIAYAFRPRLRSRLTLSGRAFLRKPWAFDGGDSHSSFVTHTGILTSKRSTCPYGQASLPLERSPTANT